MIARPSRRHTRLCHLEQLDHQRPRVRLERMHRDRRPGERIEAVVFAGCVAGMLIVSLVAMAMRGCS